MKNFILVSALLIAIQFPVTAQLENCHDEWYKTFEKYGAQPVKDGINEVIITVVKKDIANCYMGLVEVKGGKLLQGSLKVQKEDSTYVDFDRGLSIKYENNPDASLLNYVHNGMSPSFYSTHDESVTLFFVKYLNKTAKKFKQAPKPGDAGYH